MRLRSAAYSLSLACIVSLAAPLGGIGTIPCAQAAVSVQMSVGELVTASSIVAIATAIEHNSAWEDLEGGRRIVTYTRLRVERAITGECGGELWVRTLGGSVGKIGQVVSGEARLALGSTSVVFLTEHGGSLVVTGMAQGHYPLVTSDSASPVLASSPDAGVLLPRRGPTISARDELVGASLDRAIAAVLRAQKASSGEK